MRVLQSLAGIRAKSPPFLVMIAITSFKLSDCIAAAFHAGSMISVINEHLQASRKSISRSGVSLYRRGHGLLLVNRRLPANSSFLRLKINPRQEKAAELICHFALVNYLLSVLPGKAIVALLAKIV
jgi:hypothetical protein